MTTPPEILRERFEKWLDSQPPLLHKDRWRVDYASFKAGDYASPSTQTAWLAYQSATAEAERGIVPLAAEAAVIESRITQYLAVGGLFNPEMMEHDKVRDLLFDARALLARLKKGEA